LAQKQKIERIAGVQQVGHGTWFGGTYQDPKNFFAQFAFENSDMFRMYPEFILDSATITAWNAQRNAVIVGTETMERFGWTVGQTVPLQGTIYPGDWEFVIVGTYSGRTELTDDTQFIFHWDYIDQRLQQEWPERAGQVGWWVVKLDDPGRATAVSKAIDAEFDNSADETLTQTEAQFQQSFVAMSGTILLVLQVISALVIGIILLVAANTMAMTARERISEYAVLKTLGFTPWHLVGLIGGESVLIAALGGVAGLLMMFPIIRGIAVAMRSWFPIFPIETGMLIIACASVIVVGILAAIIPAARAIRISIVDGLRRVG
jgi:putative ABC transport system permease protein